MIAANRFPRDPQLTGNRTNKNSWRRSEQGWCRIAGRSGEAWYYLRELGKRAHEVALSPPSVTMPLSIFP